MFNQEIRDRGSMPLQVGNDISRRRECVPITCGQINGMRLWMDIANELHLNDMHGPSKKEWEENNNTHIYKID